MKVGTDGVLLGAWVAVRPSDVRMLDIGTGTGLIALMLAQRTEGICDSAAEEGAFPGGVHVTGVDVEDVAQARENADASPWGGRVEFVQCPVQEFAPPQRFDLIVSNPPFFVDSLTCPDRGRTTARHAVRLPFGELRDAVVRLLADGGRFAVILPTDEAARFIGLCRGHLLPIRRTDVRTTPRHPVKRVLMEFVRADDKAAEKGDAGTCAAVSRGSMSAASGRGPACSELVIGTGEHEQYTPEYRVLTRDFYLKF